MSWSFGAGVEDWERASLTTPASLGEAFEILGELGRGGMGVVLRARDRASGRLVALKLLHGVVDERARLRFRREGELTASLRHPAILRIYSGGDLGGHPFLSYELIEGCRTLKDASSEQALRGRVALLAQVANAVGYAHAAGVIHRDLKPENVLVDPQGRVKVADFGLALALDSERLTQTGGMVGSPSFMAPEQLVPGVGLLGPWTDVWALGVMLYSMLCDKLPFDADSFVQLRVQILRAPPAPSEHTQGVPPDLESICLKALSTESTERYLNASAFEIDLENWLRSRPVGASRSSILAYPWRRVRRRPLLASVLVLSVLALAPALSTWRERLARNSARPPGPGGRSAGQSLATQRVLLQQRLAFSSGRPREALESLRSLVKPEARRAARPLVETLQALLERPPRLVGLGDDSGLRLAAFCWLLSEGAREAELLARWGHSGQGGELPRLEYGRELLSAALMIEPDRPDLTARLRSSLSLLTRGSDPVASRAHLQVALTYPELDPLALALAAERSLSLDRLEAAEASLRAAEARGWGQTSLVLETRSRLLIRHGRLDEALGVLMRLESAWGPSLATSERWLRELGREDLLLELPTALQRASERHRSRLRALRDVESRGWKALPSSLIKEIRAGAFAPPLPLADSVAGQLMCRSGDWEGGLRLWARACLLKPELFADLYYRLQAMESTPSSYVQVNIETLRDHLPRGEGAEAIRTRAVILGVQALLQEGPAKLETAQSAVDALLEAEPDQAGGWLLCGALRVRARSSTRAEEPLAIAQAYLRVDGFVAFVIGLWAAQRGDQSADVARWFKASATGGAPFLPWLKAEWDWTRYPQLRPYQKEPALGFLFAKR